MTSLTARRCIVCDAEASKRCSSCAKGGVDLFFCSLEHFAKARSHPSTRVQIWLTRLNRSQVWSGHKPYCGKDSSFLSQPLEHEIAVARAQCGVPLQTTIVKHLVQAAWGFDPVETELGASDIVDEGSFRSELEKLTGIPAQTLLDHLEILGPDQPDLVPFRDVLIAGIRSINPHPSSLPAFWRTIISIRQLQGILLFTAATEWLEARQKAGEPIVDPTHELWWKLLNHRVCLAFALPPEFVPGQVEYGKRCFETARAWMQRGMDLDDPDLAEVFSTEPVAYSIVSPYLWPSKAADATLAPPAAAKKTKKVTSGSANVKLKLVQTRS
uniref:BY PROTMAP: gi/472580959/gb/EMS18720.1/ zinc finger, MYND-type domain containing protein [Rhodosporidium toruloides NP11] n=1 Tax=Rhodotorula toruloides TaxID=5286 RepID=A0A0K3CIV4_RHOTO